MPNLTDTPEGIGELARLFKSLLAERDARSPRVRRIRSYLDDGPATTDSPLAGAAPLPGLPPNVPYEMRRLAAVSRVNMMKFVVNSRVQNLYVDGFRSTDQAMADAVWDVLRRNKFHRRQIGVHRAGLGYGESFVVVMPSEDGTPVIRAVGPDKMTTLYDVGDDVWPTAALWEVGSYYRLFPGDGYAYDIFNSSAPDSQSLNVGWVHELDPTFPVPVIRYRETDDLDAPAIGLVEPLMPLQDQINLTTFGLLVAQHYAAFKQRYIVGWAAETEAEALKVSAQTITMIDRDPTEVSIGEWSESSLTGYLDSRESSLKLLSTISQTPAHELLGQLINLSAEALAAAEASKARAIEENKTCFGEDHKQLFDMLAVMLGYDVDPNAYIVWRDMDARSLSAAVDALGKAAQMLSVPVTELWELIPGVTADQLRSWRAAYDAQAAMGTLQALAGGVPIESSATDDSGALFSA
jgi:hypothetical protein